MLEFLSITNLALIEGAQLELGPGMNVLTGESGAGKSLILRAIALVLGAKGGAELVRPGAERAAVEAIFVDPKGKETILRRELSATGRSRCWVNGQLVPQSKLVELASDLVLITSQHGSQRLLAPGEHTRLVDAMLAAPEVLVHQRQALEALRQVEAAQAELEARVADLEARRDLLEYQLGEIRKVAPKAGEEAELLAARDQARASATLTELAAALQALLRGESGLLTQMATLERLLSQTTGLLPGLGGLEETQTSLLALREALGLVERGLTQAARQAAPIDLDAVERRLFELQALARRLRRPVEDLVRLEEEIEANLSALDAAGLERQRLAREANAARAALAAATGELNQARQTAAEQLTTALAGELVALGFPQAVQVLTQFQVQRIASEVEELRPRFLWAPNPGLPPQPLDRIASGGELSRFLLAITTLVRSDHFPTLIFDEIDTGIGGTTLSRVAQRLTHLAERQQLLVITHWPQLARCATRHFHVEKTVVNGSTVSHCHRLGEQERQTILASMAGEKTL